MLTYRYYLINFKSGFMSTIEEKLKQLPFLPDMIFELQKIKDSDECDTDKIFKVLEKDHFVTANILRLSNSKLFGFPNHIDTFQKAFALYGVNFTIAFSFAQVIQDSVRWNFDLYEIKTKKFFDLAYYSCKLMLLWLEDELSLKMELLFPCLIHEIGKSIISSSILEENKTIFLNSLKNNSLNISLIEKEFSNFSSSEVSAMILESWNFDKKTIELVKNIDTPNEKATYILNVIKTIFNIKSPFSKESILLGIQKANSYGLDVNHLKKAIQELNILIKNDL